MSKAKDLTGQRFGRLVAIEPTEERKHRCIVWKCQCDCGEVCFIRSDQLLSTHTQSCGCLQKQLQKEKVSKHHLSLSRIYQIWYKMKQRCYNPNLKNYKNYGGRGITVCDEWRNDFQAFHDWAMANGYDENAPRGECTIDRIDVNGNYCPENCRWVDMKTQANNKRKKEN